MDIFLLARCRFLVGTNSGPAFVPALYGTPTVMTNWWPAWERPWHKPDIFLPKLLRKLSDGRYLTLSETLSEPLGWSYSLRYLAKRCGVDVEDNDPEMIRAAVVEMFTQLDGTEGPHPDVTALRARADQIYHVQGIAGAAQLAGDFVRRHFDLYRMTASAATHCGYTCGPTGRLLSQPRTQTWTGSLIFACLR